MNSRFAEPQLTLRRSRTGVLPGSSRFCHELTQPVTRPALPLVWWPSWPSTMVRTVLSPLRARQVSSFLKTKIKCSPLWAAHP